MPSEPDWLDPEQIARLNQLVVSATGEPYSVLKPNELESACFRPRKLWHYEGECDIAALAARLMMAIACAHAFEQGNKRTGFIAATIFLDANGWLLGIGDYDDVAEQIIAAIEDHSLEGALVQLFREHLVEAA